MAFLIFISSTNSLGPQNRTSCDIDCIHIPLDMVISFEFVGHFLTFIKHHPVADQRHLFISSYFEV